MPVTTPPPTPVAEAAPAARPHLWEVDVVRLLTFSAVIGVHVLAFTEQPDNRAVAGLMMLLQYGREVFFALTAFVLMYSTWGRTVRARSVWRRRIGYVAVPYLAWSAVYYAYGVLGPQHLVPSLATFGWDLLYGGAEYHLYFLVVTLQLYLVFPLISWFVRRTAGRVGQVLIAVTALNLAWMAAVAYVPEPAGPAGWLWVHAYEILPTYTMYVLAGCYAAVHFDRITRFVRDRSRRLLQVGAASAVAALAVYAVQLGWMPPRVANQVIQPGMLLSCVAAIAVVSVIGYRWAHGPRRHQRTIQVLSEASFGVYLAHPLILQFLIDYAGFGNSGARTPAALASILGFVLAAGGATLISLAARRTPLSLALSGRPRLRLRPLAAPVRQGALA
jgi:peptidoglycan/LPS O-acetylase OafA/YrhL